MDDKDTQRLGFWSASLVTFWVVVFGLLLLGGIFGRFAKTPSFAVCLFLAPSFVAMMVSINCHDDHENKRVWAKLGVSFASIYAVLVSMTYYLQLTAVRTAPDGGPFAFAPGTALFAVDMLGYAFMCLSTLCVAPVFANGDRLSTGIRRLCIVNGLLAVPTLVAPAFMSGAATPSAANSATGDLALLSWCVVFAPFAFMVAKYFWRQQRQPCR